MKLTQNKYPFTQFEFEIDDDVMRVSAKRLLTSNGYEVPLRELSPYPSFFRAFPLPWLVAAVIFGAISGFFLYASFTPGPKLELFIGFLVMLFACLACVHGFLQRKVDYIILHVEATGQAIVHFHRRLPTEQHVKEFIEITKEQIAHAKLP